MEEYIASCFGYRFLTPPPARLWYVTRSKYRCIANNTYGGKTIISGGIQSKNQENKRGNHKTKHLKMEVDFIKTSRNDI